MITFSGLMTDIVEVEKNTEDKGETATIAGIYEVGYHIVPTVGEDGLSSEVGSVRSAIEDNGGAVFAEEWPKQMTLSYPISKDIDRKRHKFNESFFGWMKFEGTPDTAGAVNAILPTNKHMLRFVVIKTVREEVKQRSHESNLVDPDKKPVVKKETVEGPQMSKEEMDQEIEKLVV
jgi:ribosomal protein S6